MTDNRTTKLLCKLLEERGLSCQTHYLHMFWSVGSKLYEAVDNLDGTLTVDNLTPEQAIAATLGSDASAVRLAERLRSIADEMRNVGASTMTPHELLACYASDVDKVADLLTFAATLGSNFNPDGLPAGLTISDDGNLLNWRGENYARQTRDAAEGDGAMELKVKLEDGAPLPRRAHEGDAGLDLTSREAVDLWPGGEAFVSTGVSIEIPEGYVGLVFPRSGLASRHGVTLKNSVGVIDPGYRGAIKAMLVNDGLRPYQIERGERIVQLVVVPAPKVECVEVGELTDTDRGDGGFGSSGRS